jgi:nucleoside-diphosphate-sugar epimerase
MHVLTLGAGGMIGRKLTDRLVKNGALRGKPIEKFTLADIVAPAAPAGFTGKVEALAADLSQPGVAEKLVASRPDVIFHLAAIVSGEAEADFEKGYRVNLDGTRYLFEAIRKIGDDYKPRVIFTSSIAVFGAPFPEIIADDFFLTPLTSYGTQKAIGELLLADYSRKGFFDGVGIRLPTICVRPGLPNKAASGFFSGIIREPLQGKDAVLPVDESVRHWFASPRAAIDFTVHAAEIDSTPLGWRRTLSMPGLTATVGEQIAALRRVAGDKAVKLIRKADDPAVLRIVEGWPGNFDARRAKELGFKGDADFDAIIRVFIDEELGGKIAV